MPREFSPKSKNRSRGLIIDGVIFGFSLNFIFSLTYIGISDIWRAVIVGGTAIFGAYIFVTDFKSERLPFGRKLRLVFLGVSLSSFIFAIVDLFTALTAPNLLEAGPNSPALVLGVPLLSWFTSAVLGGLFNLAERLLDLREKGDI